MFFNAPLNKSVRPIQHIYQMTTFRYFVAGVIIRPICFLSEVFLFFRSGIHWLDVKIGYGQKLKKKPEQIQSRIKD